MFMISDLQIKMKKPQVRSWNLKLGRMAWMGGDLEDCKQQRFTPLFYIIIT